MFALLISNSLAFNANSAENTMIASNDFTVAPSSGAWSDDHWVKCLMLIILT